jgi:hypothetical protein
LRAVISATKNFRKWQQKNIHSMEDLEKIKEQKEQEAASLYEMMGVSLTDPVLNSHEEPDYVKPITIILSHNSHPLF